MNGFEMHGIDHLSASSLNTYAAEPALWVMEKLLGKRAPVGCAAHRGSAVEHGVSLGLFAKTVSEQGMSIEECQAEALKEYDRLTALNGDPNRQKERDAVPGCVEQALKALLPYGTPTPPPNGGRQHKISIMLDGVPVPIIGYKDFQFDQHAITVDLKTSLKMASDISPAHARQTAIYVYGTNGEARVCYATPKKAEAYRLEDAPYHIAAVTQIALRLERFLRLSKDKHELAGLVCPNFEDFRWNSAPARSAGREIYGF